MRMRRLEDLRKARGGEQDPSHGNRFSFGGERWKRPCVKISVHVRDAQMVLINQQSSTAKPLTDQE